VVSAPGGGGAARELIERILKVQGRWDAIVESYLNEPRELGSAAR
jgi:3-deoxy-D-manno-octulosonate 8-phosphate phosphatase KdsC-like HAD superfamily phosphatase